jgi:DNA polymerase I
MTVLAIDFMNAAHRARSGFQLGPAPVVFNFFRQFKSLVDQFKPTKIYVALEGRPVHRYEALDEYKANRKVDPDDPKAKELEKFFTQVNQIVNLLSNYFPVSVVRHPTSECDDTLANLVKNSNPKEDWIIISSDTDFIQLLQEHDNLRLYNPVQKRFIEAPEYPYITWKALRGDSSDNIPGIPGIGDKTADKLASDYELLKEFINRPEVEPIFTRNL